MNKNLGKIALVIGAMSIPMGLSAMNESCAGYKAPEQVKVAAEMPEKADKQEKQRAQTSNAAMHGSNPFLKSKMRQQRNYTSFSSRVRIEPSLVAKRLSQRIRSAPLFKWLELLPDDVFQKAIEEYVGSSIVSPSLSAQTLQETSLIRSPEMEKNYKESLENGVCEGSKIVFLDRNLTDVRICDVATQKVEHTIRLENPTEHILFNSSVKNPRFLTYHTAAADQSCVFKVWNVQTGEQQCQFSHNLQYSILDEKFSADGTKLAVLFKRVTQNADVDGPYLEIYLGIWDTSTGERLHWIESLSDDIPNEYYLDDVSLQWESDRTVSIFTDATDVHTYTSQILCDLSRNTFFAVQPHETKIVISPDEKFFAHIKYDEGTMVLFDKTKNKPLKKFTSKGLIEDVIFSKDGRKLFFIHEDFDSDEDLIPRPLTVAMLDIHAEKQQVMSLEVNTTDPIQYSLNSDGTKLVVIEPVNSLFTFENQGEVENQQQSWKMVQVFDLLSKRRVYREEMSTAQFLPGCTASEDILMATNRISSLPIKIASVFGEKEDNKLNASQLLFLERCEKELQEAGTVTLRALGKGRDSKTKQLEEVLKTFSAPQQKAIIRNYRISHIDPALIEHAALFSPVKNQATASSARSSSSNPDDESESNALEIFRGSVKDITKVFENPTTPTYKNMDRVRHAYNLLKINQAKRQEVVQNKKDKSAACSATNNAIKELERQKEIEKTVGSFLL